MYVIVRFIVEFSFVVDVAVITVVGGIGYCLCKRRLVYVRGTYYNKCFRGG